MSSAIREVRLRRWTGLALLLVVVACATTVPEEPVAGPGSDEWERWCMQLQHLHDSDAKHDAHIKALARECRPRSLLLVEFHACCRADNLIVVKKPAHRFPDRTITADACWSYPGCIAGSRSGAFPGSDVRLSTTPTVCSCSPYEEYSCNENACPAGRRAWVIFDTLSDKPRNLHWYRKAPRYFLDPWNNQVPAEAERSKRK